MSDAPKIRPGTGPSCRDELLECFNLGEQAAKDSPSQYSESEYCTMADACRLGQLQFMPLPEKERSSILTAPDAPDAQPLPPGPKQPEPQIPKTLSDEDRAEIKRSLGKVRTLLEEFLKEQKEKDEKKLPTPPPPLPKISEEQPASKSVFSDEEVREGVTRAMMAAKTIMKSLKSRLPKFQLSGAQPPKPQPVKIEPPKHIVSIDEMKRTFAAAEILANSRMEKARREEHSFIPHIVKHSYHGIPYDHGDTEAAYGEVLRKWKKRIESGKFKSTREILQDIWNKDPMARRGIERLAGMSANALDDVLSVGFPKSEGGVYLCDLVFEEENPNPKEFMEELANLSSEVAGESLAEIKEVAQVYRKEVKYNPWMAQFIKEEFEDKTVGTKIRQHMNSMGMLDMAMMVTGFGAARLTATALLSKLLPASRFFLTTAGKITYAAVDSAVMAGAMTAYSKGLEHSLTARDVDLSAKSFAKETATLTICFGMLAAIGVPLKLLRGAMGRSKMFGDATAPAVKMGTALNTTGKVIFNSVGHVAETSGFYLGDKISHAVKLRDEDADLFASWLSLVEFKVAVHGANKVTGNWIDRTNQRIKGKPYRGVAQNFARAIVEGDVRGKSVFLNGLGVSDSATVSEVTNAILDKIGRGEIDPATLQDALDQLKELKLQKEVHRTAAHEFGQFVAEDGSPAKATVLRSLGVADTATATEIADAIFSKVENGKISPRKLLAMLARLKEQMAAPKPQPQPQPQPFPFPRATEPPQILVGEMPTDGGLRLIEQGRFVATTDQGIGYSKGENQDTVVISNGVMVVVDGMGGEGYGAVAAKAAAKKIAEKLAEGVSVNHALGAANEAVKAAVKEAMRAAGDQSKYEKGGAVVVGMRVIEPEKPGEPHRVIFEWAGDAQGAVLGQDAQGRWHLVYVTVDETRGRIEVDAMSPAQIAGRDIELLRVSHLNANTVMNGLGRGDSVKFKTTVDGVVPDPASTTGERNAHEYADGVLLDGRYARYLLLGGSDGLLENFVPLKYLVELIDGMSDNREITRVLREEAHYQMGVLAEARVKLVGAGGGINGRMPFEYKGMIPELHRISRLRNTGILFIDGDGNVFSDAHVPLDALIAHFKTDNISIGVGIFEPPAAESAPARPPEPARPTEPVRPTEDVQPPEPIPLPRPSLPSAKFLVNKGRYQNVETLSPGKWAIIGWGLDCEIPIMKEKNTESWHAFIDSTPDGRYYIENYGKDMETRVRRGNYTFVLNDILHQIELFDGDVIRIGRQKIRFELEGESRPEPLPTESVPDVPAPPAETPLPAPPAVEPAPPPEPVGGPPPTPREPALPPPAPESPPAPAELSPAVAAPVEPAPPPPVETPAEPEPLPPAAAPEPVVVPEAEQVAEIPAAPASPIHAKSSAKLERGVLVLKSGLPAKIGRRPGLEITTPADDHKVSAEHAVVGHLQGDRFFVRDLGSKNGTRIVRGDAEILVHENPDKVEGLLEGDVLIIGGQRFQVRIDEARQQAEPPPAVPNPPAHSHAVEGGRIPKGGKTTGSRRVRSARFRGTRPGLPATEHPRTLGEIVRQIFERHDLFLRAERALSGDPAYEVYNGRATLLRAAVENGRTVAAREENGHFKWERWSGRPAGRFYITLGRAGYIERSAAVTRALHKVAERTGAKFGFKVYQGENGATRRDHIVVYFEAADGEATLGAVREAMGLATAEIGDALMYSPKGPYFTRKLGDGLFFGEEPALSGYESFGTLRKRAIRNAMDRIIQMERESGSEVSIDVKRDILSEELESAGVDPEEPAFNAGTRINFPYIN